MKEFIQELKQNQEIKGTETVKIDYIIERLEDIQKEYNKHINKRIDFLNSMIDYNIETNEEEALKYMYSKLELETIKRKIEGSTDEESN